MKKCLISYAKNGREQYEKALKRSENIVNKICPDVDKIFYYRDLPKGCPTHQEVPYAFKPYIFKQAFDKGYTKVIWLDSTIVTVKAIDKLWDFLEVKGVLAFHNLGHPLKNWVSDVALEAMGISDEDLNEIEQIMACVVGFDISNPKGKKVFDEWFALAEGKVAFQNYGSNRTGFVAHRHDQACLSALLWKHHIKMLPYGKLVYEPHDVNKQFGDDFYFVNKAI